TQFKHTALLPAVQLGNSQGFAVTVANVSSATATCTISIRGSDGSLLNKHAAELPGGETTVEGFPAGALGQPTMRLVVTSTSSKRSNPCLPLVEVLSFPSQGVNHVDAIVSDAIVTNSAT
ncbi:MAG TPA: hypothetical protein VNN79_06775, partial [Actinomycetota bacterium]|nr:hypothetical protein [Actinomycetota bacterium]